MAKTRSVRATVAAHKAMQAALTDWWMCRRDTDPEGVWFFRLDPYADAWDWRIRIGQNKKQAERRVRAALEKAHSMGLIAGISEHDIGKSSQGKVSTRTDKNLAHIREIVDRVRGDGRKPY